MQTEETIIYVAGNPELYPLEYYDPESGAYQGAIPDFLARFAGAYGYDLRYICLLYTSYCLARSVSLRAQG